MNAPPISPIVKWAGGKTRLLADLVARCPSSFGRYFEPFAGGAALFFRLRPELARLGDVNLDLMTLYETVRCDEAGVLRFIELHRRAHGKRHYYATRRAWNARRHKWYAAERAAAFLYLNRTCFNGLWRVNQSGEFNVPIGKYRKPMAIVPEIVRAASIALRHTEIRCGDYFVTAADASKGDFVYIDPPYDPAKGTPSFTSYSAAGFGTEDQRKLAKFAHDLVGRGCKLMLSNSDTKFVRDLYKGKTFKISGVTVHRSISADVDRRNGAAREVIITGGY